ncbi:MAG: YncE family protein, partial [Acidimicrobiia bacterium]|nr:YncE family protein [Acidimicrobiia bacterium]
GTKAYVANQVGNSVSVINTTNNTVSATILVGTAPIGVAITPDGTKAYVANNGTDSVSVINTVTNAVSATTTVGTDPIEVAICPAAVIPPTTTTTDPAVVLKFTG